MKENEVIRIMKSIFFRNKIILTDFKNRSKKNIVNLHWWKLSGKFQNVGDWLSLIVVDFIKELKNIDVSCCGTKTVHLFAIGSIIDGGYQDATIWGSGIRVEHKKLWWRIFRKLDIRCVRGPETRRILLENGYDCPEIYGDPAVLMPMIYQPSETEKIYEYRVVPHMSYDVTEYPNVLSPYVNDWKEFIDEIVKSNLIISSSLHGIILAEAYGIPAILLNDKNMDLFKYRDYYYSTGRKNLHVAKSVEEALKMTPMPIPDLTKMKSDLINVFPVDIYYN